MVCGVCAWCRTGKGHLCPETRILGVHRDGVFADFVVVPASNAWPDPPDMPLSIASLGVAVVYMAALGGATNSLPTAVFTLAPETMPTLLLAGARDPKFVAVAERMAPEMPAATVVIVPDAGHTVHLDRPDAWLEAVLHHLALR